METRLKVERPDDIKFTMTITMTAGMWGIFRDQMYTAVEGHITRDPMRWIIHNIDDLLGQARKIFWPKEVEQTKAIPDDGGILASDVGIMCDEHGPAYPGDRTLIMGADGANRLLRGAGGNSDNASYMLEAVAREKAGEVL